MMTPEEKQAALKRWLPEIAKAVWSQFDDWEYDNFDVWSDEYGGHVDLLNDDRDSAYMRRVLGVDVIWHTEESSLTASIFDAGIYAGAAHDGTPEGKGEAERWAVLQAAAKKLGLE